MAKKPAPLTSDLLVRKGEATPSSVNPADRSSDVGMAGGAPTAPLSSTPSDGGRPQTPEPEIVLAADEDTDETHGSRRRLAAVLGLVAVVTATVLAINMFGSEDPTLSVAPVGSTDDVATAETPNVAPVISAPEPASVGAPTAPEPDLRLAPAETIIAEVDVASSPAPAEPATPVVPVTREPITVETVPVAPPREAATITPPQPVSPVETSAPEVVADISTQPTAPTVATAGQYLVQILSVRSERAARSAWSRIQIAHGTLLANETLNIEQADLGERGTFYRVRFGAFNVRGDANAVCKSLKAEGQDCLVKRVN
ncbi:MAG: SPOR domain-containing protein [Rhodobiaceae bacterium]|nr:SPOR domain-containing protein [Rhodobiaceae bacterium]